VKEIVVISGKGGTGKTSLVACLAVLAQKAVTVDCDVDAADLYLTMNPEVIKTEDFSGGKGAEIIREKCTACGKCLEVCRFDAVVKRGTDYVIDPIACEGCGVCSWFCPSKAIDFKPVVNGKWFISKTSYGPLVHAKLGVAEENSGKLVALVRGQARTIAEKEELSYIIVDGPPGIGCPVIASITGSDTVIIVTEPTISGAHDLERVADLAGYFKVPAYLCINKYDINKEMSKKIEEKAIAKGVKVLGRIRYDRSVIDAQIKGVPVVMLKKSPAGNDIKRIWGELVSRIN